MVSRPWERPVAESGYPSVPSQADIMRARIAGAHCADAITFSLALSPAAVETVAEGMTERSNP